MTTIEKTIEIPENRRVNLELDLPENIPAGVANIQVTVNSLQMKKVTWKDLQKFQGCLKDFPIFEGDAVEIQRKMRDE
jgi:sporulation-control protein spo0M